MGKILINLWIDDSLFTEDKEYTFTPGGPGVGYNQYVKRDFVMDPKNSLLPNNALTVHVEISIIRDEDLSITGLTLSE